MQCTARNQPKGISWAMPRASFLSVFTGIVLKALRKAKVALARKLAVVLHRMLRDETVFVAHRS